MYLPYIRAKQFDLLAIIELKDSIYRQKPITPIIEPVTSIKVNPYKRLAEKKIQFILIVNPIVGDLKSTTPHKDIIAFLVNDLFAKDDNCVLGFIIHPSTTLPEVKNFIGNFPNHSHAFIHFHQFADAKGLAKLIAADKNAKFDIFIEWQVSLGYVNTFSISDAPDIIIRDGFNKQPKNELYPDEDFFFDLHKIYENEMGYNGFGDFTIIGSEFEKGGGPAYVVALHLTDKDASKNLIVKHFKSDVKVPPSPVDPGGKFKQALGRLKRYVDSSTLKSTGVDEFLELHRTGHFPGLGIPKKISIKHHIEMVATLI